MVSPSRQEKGVDPIFDASGQLHAHIAAQIAPGRYNQKDFSLVGDHKALLTGDLTLHRIKQLKSLQRQLTLVKLVRGATI
jgi:hypothetical protein